MINLHMVLAHPVLLLKEVAEVRIDMIIKQHVGNFLQLGDGETRTRVVEITPSARSQLGHRLPIGHIFSFTYLE